MAGFGNPRFMFDHLLRTGGYATVTVDDSSGFRKEALHDGQNGPLWIGDDGSTVESMVLARVLGNVNPFRFPAQRIIIPATLKSFRDSFQRIEVFSEDVNPPTVTVKVIQRIDPTISGIDADFHAAPDLWDFEFEASDDVETYLMLKFFNTVGNADQEAGEVYVSGIFEPSVGHIPVWEDVDEPNNFTATTSAGNTYSLSRGDPRRVWRLRYEKVPEFDTFRFDALRRAAGISLHGFWFDPPGFREEELVRTAGNSLLGTWTFQDLLVGLFNLADANSNPAGTDHHLQWANTGVGNHLCWSKYTFTFPQDLRGRFISVDVRAELAHFSGANTLSISFSSDDFATQLAEFEISQIYGPQAPSAEYRRIFIDPSVSTVSLAGTAPHTSPDWSAITGIRLNQRAAAAGSIIRWDNFHSYLKEGRPKFVELLEYDKRQSSEAPSNKVKYDIELTLREVLS